MTWYVVRGDVAVATDASEAYGVSAAVGLGENSEAVWIDDEFLIADSAAGVSAAVEVAKLSAAA
jgi:hypothetical protein